MKAAAAVLGFREQDIVECGVVLMCTYVLKRVQPEREEMGGEKKEVAEWLPGELARALASSFVSKRGSRRGLRGSRSRMGNVSPISSVGSVLRSLGGVKPSGGSGKALGGS